MNISYDYELSIYAGNNLAYNIQGSLGNGFTYAKTWRDFVADCSRPTRADILQTIAWLCEDNGKCEKIREALTEASNSGGRVELTYINKSKMGEKEFKQKIKL